VFYVDNIADEVSEDDLKDFLRDMNVRVFSCHQVARRKGRNNNIYADVGHAFRVCIHAEDQPVFLISENWPSFVRICQWYFKANAGSTSQTHPEGRVSTDHYHGESQPGASSLIESGSICTGHETVAMDAAVGTAVNANMRSQISPHNSTPIKSTQSDDTVSSGAPLSGNVGAPVRSGDTVEITEVLNSVSTSFAGSVLPSADLATLPDAVPAQKQSTGHSDVVSGDKGTVAVEQLVSSRDKDSSTHDVDDLMDVTDSTVIETELSSVQIINDE
jgi:hypothetical protein